MQLRVDPVRVVRGVFVEGERTWPPADCGLTDCLDPWQFALELRDSCSAVRHPSRARVLDDFISDPRAVELKSLARALGVSWSDLSLAFPVRYARARLVRAERLDRERRRRSQEYDDLLPREIAAGAPRSIVEISSSHDIHRNALRDFAPQRFAQLVALRESSYSTRATDLTDRLRVALRAALEVPDGPTVSEIARSFGLPSDAARRLCPDEARLLLARRRDEDEAKSAGYVQAMHENVDSASPVGVDVLARRLGICRATLQRADPELYAKMVAAHAEFRGRHVAAQRERSRQTHEHRNALRARLTEAVERELHSDAPRSVCAVASDAGVEQALLKHYCPDGCRRLAELRALARSQRTQTLCDALEQEIRAPRPRTLSVLADSLQVTRRTLVRECPSLVADLRAVAKPAPRRQRPRPADARVIAALEAELRSSSPRSLRVLSREHDIHRYTFSRVAPGLVERLLLLRAENRSSQDARLRARIVPALNAALRHSEPPSVAAVARELEVSPLLIQRLAPELYRELVRRWVATGRKTRGSSADVRPSRGHDPQLRIGI